MNLRKSQISPWVLRIMDAVVAKVSLDRGSLQLNTYFLEHAKIQYTLIPGADEVGSHTVNWSIGKGTPGVAVKGSMTYNIHRLTT